MPRGHTQLPMAHLTTMGPWLTGIISTLSGMSTHLLMAYFLPPHASLQRKKARERDPWLSFCLFSSFLSQTPSPLAPGSFLILEFPSGFRGRGNTISCTFCWQSNWCYLSPIVLHTIRFGPDWGQEWRCASSCIPCPLNNSVIAKRCHFKDYSHLLGILLVNSVQHPNENHWMYSKSY